jgi:hypothetical protein
MRIVRPLIRKATKTVVYPLVPAVPIVKSLTVGTYRGNQARAELRRQSAEAQKQTALLQRQNELLASQTMQAVPASAPLGPAGWIAQPTGGWVSPTGRLISYDGISSAPNPGAVPRAGVNAPVACLACGATNHLSEAATEFSCSACGRYAYLRLCPHSCSISQIPHDVAAAPRIVCNRCGVKKPWKAWQAACAAQWAQVHPAERQPDLPIAPDELSVADEIAKLAQLRSNGALTEDEFTAAKARLLDS